MRYDFFLGYSGWGEEQLKDELTSHSWLISRINPNEIFDTAVDMLWKKTLQEMGKDQALLATFPEDPSLN